MALSIVKESIEIEAVTTDATGNAYVTKRINLKEGYRHRLVQVDMFSDAITTEQVFIETVITPYPAIPTNMQYSPTLGLTNRYPSGGSDSVLFKEKRSTRVNPVDSDIATQFPSSDIAAMNAAQFYSDHVYINMHFMTLSPDTLVENIAFSFLLVLDDKKVSTLTHALGVLSESHEAMCALSMSNGHMVSIVNLRGNTFPSWRFGGIRPEHTITPIAANSFFLEIDTRDGEQMVDTASIRQSVADAREMSPFDAAFGIKRPDWLKMDLNAGIVSGPIRSDPVPLKYADNGNTLMF
jgi:hypothetical protein